MKSTGYLAVTATLALTACANLPDDDHTSVVAEPIVNGTAAAEYPEAAILNMPLTATTGAACSGTLIAPRVILTAGHCVDGFSRWEVYVGATLRTSTSGVTYDWAEHGATTVNPNHHDLGLVFLDTPIVIARYPTLAASPLPAGSTVLNVGRIRNGTLTNTAWQAPAIVRDGASVGYPYDYAAGAVIEHGDSGGPGFAQGTHTLVSVNSGGSATLEVLARVDLLRDWITAQVNAHGGMTVPTTDAGAGAPTDAGAADTGVRADASTPADTGAVDAGAADTGVRADAGAADAGARTDAGTPAAVDAGSSACAAASGRNTTLATADSLAGCARGSLTTAAPAQHFVFTPVSGTTYTVRLAPAGDATFTVGVVTVSAAGSTCAPLASGLTGVQITLSGSVRTVCLVVASSSRAAQTFSLTRN